MKEKFAYIQVDTSIMQSIARGGGMLMTGTFRFVA